MASSQGASKGALVTRAKSAAVALSEYEDSKLVERFGPVAESIRAKGEESLGFGVADVTPRSLASLVAQLRLFGETALGRGSSKSSRPITKIPHRLFLDYSPGGAVEVMVCSCLRFKESSGLRRLDFQNADKRSFYLDLLKLVQKNLLRAGLLRKFSIYLSPAIPASTRERLISIIKPRATHVLSPDEATHVVYPDPPGTTPAETDGTDYCRTIELAPPLALVHWWYHPDSYDSWIPVADVQGDPEPEDDSKGPLHVHVRWLDDTHAFNEWMNELDYEVAEELRKGVPRQAQPSSSSSKKKKGNSSGASGGDDHDSKKSSKKRKRAESSSTGRDSQARDSGQNEPNATKEGERRDKRVSDVAGGSTGSGEGRRDREREGEREGERDRQRESERERDRDKDRSRDRDRGRDRDREKERERRRDRERDREGNRERDRDRDRRDKARDREIERVRDRERDRGDRSRNRDRDRERDGRRESSDRDHGNASGDNSEASRRRRRDSSSDRLKSGSAREGVADSAQPNKRVKTSHEEVGGKSGLKVRINVNKRTEASDGPRNTDDVEGGDGGNTGGHGQTGFRVRVKMPTSAPAPVGETKPDEDTGDSGDVGDGGAGSRKVISKNGATVKVPEGGPDSGDKNARHGKSKKKKDKRGSQPRNVGVSFVENAEPIAEADIKRIRNISMDITINPDDGNRAEDSQPALAASDGVDNDGMDVDDRPEYRSTAVAGAGLDGKRAGAPVSAVDLIESLPRITLRIPTQSRWFRLDAIHEVEKRSLPEFFSSRSASKTPSVYKTYRDFIIDTWRQSPTTYLTATSVRRHLAGDVCAILRVHAFLEHWGLINFGVQPETRPHNSVLKGIRRESWNAAPIVDQASTGGAGAGGSGSSGIPRLLLFDEFPASRRNVPPASLSAVADGTIRNAGGQKTDIPLATRREVYATSAALKYECDACGDDCSRMRYHCVGQMDLDLCPTCFADGRYPSTLAARDFEQLTTVGSSDAYDGSVWSEAEVLLLLEGLEKFGDDWNAVAGHVKTKTNEQCVMQFLRMPIEDSFLGDQLGKWGRGGTGGKGAAARAASGEHIFAGAPLPFADASNPVMAQIAFLASSVSPEVAAAAAQAALTKIMQDTGATGPQASGPSVGATPERTRMANTLMNSGDGSAPGAPQANGAPSGGQLPNGIPGGSQASPQTGQVQPQSAPAGQRPPPGRAQGSIPGVELDTAAVEASAAVALAAAAARARKLADAEVRELERVFAVVVETKLRVIEEKMKGFSQLEELTRAERDRLERQRNAIYADRVNAAIARTGGEGDFRQPHPGGVTDAVPRMSASVPVETIPSLSHPLPPSHPPGHGAS